MLVKVHQTIRDDYVQPLSATELMRSGARGMLESLHDPYASFFGPEEMRRFHEGNSGVLVGIGVMLNNLGDILYPQPGGFAEAAGIRPGDRFLAIEQEDVADADLAHIAKLLRGEAGTTVHLVLQRRDGSTYQADVERNPVPTVTVGDVRMVDEELGIGHIHIRSFAHSTVAEFDHALERLQAHGLQALILDLRWNPGGQLPSAVGVASRFLDGHLVCTLENRYGPTESRYALSKDGKFFGMPLVILVNGGSASGSEVVAAALRERGFAVLVGSRTYGKGIYQQVFEYEAGSFALQFTAGYYITPAGHVLESHLNPEIAGCLEPDIPIATEAAEDLAIRLWQGRNPPPAAYRDEVYATFPGMKNLTPPADRCLDAALSLLRQSLVSDS